MGKKVFVQNMVTPYRCGLYNYLFSIDNSYWIYYATKSEKDRNWKDEDLPMFHNYWIDKGGWHFSIHGINMHFNPHLIWKLFKMLLKP